nr:acid phosphatase 1-like [Ipomoea batatas]
MTIQPYPPQAADLVTGHFNPPIGSHTEIESWRASRTPARSEVVTVAAAHPKSHFRRRGPRRPSPSSVLRSPISASNSSKRIQVEAIEAGVWAIAYNSTKFNEWVSEAKSPAIPASLRFYNVLLSLGIRPVFLTGVREVQREARTTNLLQAGYQNWEKLILKGVNETRSGVVFKSGKRTELVNAGYRIVGNMGDQWSDLLGADAGDRTFKVPDPMYYIG